MVSRVLPIALASVLSLAAPPSIAHDWYDPGCCSGGDCTRINVKHAPIPVPGGWLFRDGIIAAPDGVFKGWAIPPGTFVDSSKARHSKDGEWHVCASNHVAGLVFCIYIPPMGA